MEQFQELFIILIELLLQFNPQLFLINFLFKVIQLFNLQISQQTSSLDFMNFTIVY